MAHNKGYTREDYEAALQRNSGNVTAAANDLGILRTTLQRVIKRWRDKDPAIADAMKAVNTELTPVMAWAKTKSEDGTSYSVLLKPQVDPVDMAESIREALEGMEPAPAIDPPKDRDEDLCTVYPLMDVHFGMLAWGRETGVSDYDTTIARADMRRAYARMLQRTPASERAVLIIGGDFFHADDNRNETPQHKHKLDTDSRHWRVLDKGIALLAEVIEWLAAKHAEVIVRVMRGNHDEHSHLVLTFALAERYRRNERVTVEKEPRDLFVMQWGRCLIAAHHGDKAPAERMALYLSDVCDFWSETRHRYMFTGHVHKDQARDVGPLRYESLRAFCPQDSYAAGMGYTSRRAVQSITFDRRHGVVVRAMDPVE